jgi:hypothetical protein
VATQRTIVVALSDPGGYDAWYTSLNAAEATEQDDLIALDRNLVIECEAFEDTTAVVLFAGWTTAEENNVVVRAAAGHEHNGVPDTSYRITASNSFGAAFTISAIYVTLEGLQGKNTGFNAATAFSLAVRNTNVRNCLAIGGDTGFVTNASDCTIRNCVADGCETAGFNSTNFDVTEFYNCTAIDCGIGFSGQTTSGTFNFSNCVAYGSTTSDFTGDLLSKARHVITTHPKMEPRPAQIQ